MSLPYTQLQASPDFSIFKFISPGARLDTLWQVRLTGRKDSTVYYMDLRDHPVEKKRDPLSAEDTDMDRILATVIQIIEIYTERYPLRIIRLRGDTRPKAIIFRAALDKYRSLLCPLFTIKTIDCDERDNPEPDPEQMAFYIRRRPIPLLTIHTIQSTWSGMSRLFGRPVSIGLDKGVRVGLTLPGL